MKLEFIGYLGGLLIAVALTPQLIKTWATKSAKDISLLWMIISLMGLVLYVIYAAINKVSPLLTFAATESFMLAILIILKITFDNYKD